VVISVVFLGLARKQAAGRPRRAPLAPHFRAHYNPAMASLELKFLGELEVVRGGEPMPLPPSRKTRALLAYLALNRRSFRREHLCELLWEIPDDPRGSLRWSLSKLRRLVDDDGCPRIVADRASVGFDASDVAIDIVTLKNVADTDLEAQGSEALEQAAARYGGHFLEGLELANFHEFDAWAVAERELATRAQARILEALTRRLAADPERALPHARALVRLSPYDEGARAGLIRLLVALGRADQAAQQYEAGKRMLDEARIPSSGELFRAWRGAPGTTPARAPAQPLVLPQEPAPRAPAAVPTDPASDARLIGRDAELARVAQALESAATERRGGVLLIDGEAGIGKTRLLEATAALARERGAVILSACAYESESMRPMALWSDALQALGPDALASVFGPGAHTNRDDLFTGLSDAIGASLQSHTVVLAFDDLQWCDESSAAALHYVARTNRQAPLLTVLAARDDELRDNAAMQRSLRDLRQAGLLEQVTLGPLEEDALRDLIASRTAQASAERLSRECGGNPLLAIELARAEAAGDSGRSLAELVQERLARLDLAQVETLRWAAVLAPRVDAGALARVSGLDWNVIGATLETAARQSILKPTEDGFRFSHDRIARCIYAEISPLRRRTMHRRVAEMLEQATAVDLEHAADLAHHAAQSGDAALAARAMVSAGRLCLRFFANTEALSLARKGLQRAEQLPPADRVRLTIELREIALAAAPIEDWEAAAAEYAALAEQALDHGALSHARLGYYMASYVRWMHGQWAGAREDTLQAERVTRGGSDEDHIIGMAEAARCLAMLERDLTHADAMLMEAQALAARRRIVHCAIPAALGMLRYHENELDEAEELFKEARTLAKSAGDRLSEFQANEYLAMIDFERGRLDAAKVHCAALVELGAKVREGSEGPFSRALQGLCHYAETDDDGPLDAAIEELRVVDAKHRLAYSLTRAALLDIERGRADVATARASEALEYAEALNRSTEIVLAHVALARARQAADDATGYAEHAAALGDLENAPVARWARNRAAAITAERTVHP
jgi:DNA-binding SARP family transcriptional activator